jgi:uncharacterized protein
MSKRSHSEDEWFARHERDLIEDLRRERLRREQRMVEAMRNQEAVETKALHWMHCPECGSLMKKEDAGKIDVFRCPLCGGLFFQREKLEHVFLASEEERKNTLHGVLHLMFPHWKAHQSESDEKIIAEYHRDHEMREKMIAEKLADGEAIKAKEFHHMHCPNCGTKLKALQLQHNLVLDECPLCRGVFFHYGEFEVIQKLSEEQRKTIRIQFLKMGVS